jgi:hypothetical protein
VEGKVLRPGDELRGVKPGVRLANQQRAGTRRLVGEWNRAVSFEITTR